MLGPRFRSAPARLVRGFQYTGGPDVQNARHCVFAGLSSPEPVRQAETRLHCSEEKGGRVHSFSSSSSRCFFRFFLSHIYRHIIHTYMNERDHSQTAHSSLSKRIGIQRDTQQLQEIPAGINYCWKILHYC